MLQSRTILVRFKKSQQISNQKKNQGAAQDTARCCQMWVFHPQGGLEMRQPAAESDLLPWRKEQWTTQTTDTPNTPSSSHNGWKYL